MRRRQFITLLGGATAWPFAARAQQAPRLRRVGILMPFPPSDSEWQSRVGALRQELQRLGWTRGGNIEFDERWTTDNMDLVRANAADLVELKPDATYVDRILRGEKPGELSFQQPTKYQLAINVKTAKALGLAVPLPLLATADEVIE
jgi:putative ABC transport system substrate-binding protein